jgi:hypothetical protein
MGIVYGLTPYFKDAGRVASVGGTKCDHASPLAIAAFLRHGSFPQGVFPLAKSPQPNAAVLPRIFLRPPVTDVFLEKSSCKKV